TTKADLFLNEPLQKLGKGVFEKEVNRLVMEGNADIAVHSMKDLTSQLDPGLEVIATLKRDSPYDALVADSELFKLEKGSIIGTSSLRRKNIISFFRSDINVADIRGNIDTRLSKVKTSQYAGIIIAHASLQRLNIETKYFVFSPYDFTPEVNQGIIAIVSRKDNIEMKKVLSEIDDKETHSIAETERTASNIIGGGCNSPFGIFFEFYDKEFHGIATFSDSKKKITVETWSRENEKISGEKLGKTLLRQMKNEGIIL
ncbi:hydroxymethylbilane synthase, partial [Acidianus sp. RZ1]|uniref:hydroxymethylbilane synthase n=1 Tax=Acidianus sp. RZ1 TaxID=1540082 RepID=UPI001490A8E7